MGRATLVGGVFKMLAVAADAWLLVLVKCGDELIKPRQVVKCDWGETFAALLDKLDLQEMSVAQVEISTNEKFNDPVHTVPINAPLSLTDQFKCSFVRFSLESGPQQPMDPQAGRNAADLLMAASRRIVLPPPRNKIVGVAVVCSNMEAQHYSSVLVHFPPVCCYFRLGEESLVKESYAIVPPIVFYLCK